MEDGEKFNGDCKVLQDRLRRYCELVGEEVHELPDGTISSDMAYDTTLTLFAEPSNENECECYGFISYRERKKGNRNIDTCNVQYFYDKLNLAIAEIEHKED
jgi:hypothetical protein